MKILAAIASIVTIITGIFVLWDRMDSNGKHYGAISYTNTGLYGSSWSQAGSDEAKNSALKDCKTQAKGKTCKTRMLQDQECAALVRTKKTVDGKKRRLAIIGLGKSSDAAQVTALKTCDRKNKKDQTKAACKIVTSVCADGRHS